LGIIQPICNVDIYPNFGNQMPGCDGLCVINMKL
jgi:hypothetical protein